MIAIVSPSENRAIQTENPSRIIREITAKLARNFASFKNIILYDFSNLTSLKIFFTLTSHQVGKKWEITGKFALPENIFKSYQQHIP